MISWIASTIFGVHYPLRNIRICQTVLRRRLPSGFTAHAVEFSRSVEGLVLIDGNRLVNLMMDNEVGVTSQQIKLPKIDMDYFEQ
ncbi:TPA: hypothetical protein MIC17_28125 [Klebsiella pneumoniae]|nr:hypothetical protein [Klebsiella pneumoniae]HBX6949549.1 hypothetical protein [Klebsiella pneumoniae]HBX7057421.1 hypothetical protein [Klebsiella pneumoniae]HBX7084165.1 hypothetical protein [Klebsiella pneumoniae]HBX7110974.1 hypothetical protein [Klebsiella pneumoniae]